MPLQKTNYHFAFLFSKNCLFILFLIFPFNEVYPQSNYDISFSLLSELPETNVYRVEQDNQGFLWFATGNGICRYDGEKVKTYQKADGLTDQGCFHIMKQKNGKLWFILMNGDIASFTGSGFKTYSFRNDNTLFHIIWIFETGDGSLILTTREGSIIKFRPGKKLEFRKITDGRQLQHGIESKKGNYIFAVPEYLVFSSPDTIVFKPILRWTFYALGRFFKLSDNSILYTDAYGIYQIKGREIKQLYFYNKDPLRSEILCLSELSSGEIWAGTLTGILVLKREGEKLTLKRRIHSNLIVTSITEDHEKNLWLSTFNNGVKCIYHNESITFTSKKDFNNTLLTAISNEENKILLFSADGSLFTVQDNKTTFIKKLHLPKGYQINEIIKTAPMEYILTSGSLPLLLRKDLTVSFDTLEQFGGKPNAFIDQQGRTFFINWQMIGLQDKDSTTIFHRFKRNHNLTHHIRHMIVDPDSVFWIGTRQGLYKYYPKKDLLTASEFPELMNVEITAVKSFENEKWIITRGSGVYIIKDKKVTQFNVPIPDVLSICNDLQITKNLVWFASNHGVYTYNKKTSEVIVYKTGLPVKPVNKLLLLDDKIIAMNGAGISIFREDQNRVSGKIPLVFTGITINGKESDLKHIKHLSYLENNLSISFKGLSYERDNSINYYYQLLPDTTWQKSTFSGISFSSLSPGNYSFNVKALDEKGRLSDEVKLDFSIDPPYWKTWWFYSLSAFLIIGGTFLSVNRRISQVKKKNELQKRMLTAELNALRSQMNPHFIFNSLNSIQDFIMNSDSILANKYLSKFSKLMRQIINNSRRSRISIEEEINFLKIYLELEQIRFTNPFQFEIIIADGLEIEFLEIPPMLIQPIVENSIKHGFANTGKDELKIFLRSEEEFLICEVIDNGFGRDYSRKINKNRSSDHQSIGMSNTGERLSLFESSVGSKGVMIIEDLYDDQQNAKGTRVILKIP